MLSVQRFYASASRVLDQMLEQHSDKPELFQLAAQWELEECMCVSKARKFLLNGLHIHKESRLLFKEAFKLELIHANNLRKEAKGELDRNQIITVLSQKMYLL